MSEGVVMSKEEEQFVLWLFLQSNGFKDHPELVLSCMRSDSVSESVSDLALNNAKFVDSSVESESSKSRMT